MIYLMNSAVMPAGNYGTYDYQPATLDNLQKVLHGDLGPWESRIGYPQNIDLIYSWTGVRIPLDRSETRFQPNDEAFIMRLRQRMVNPAAKGSPVSSDPDCWEFGWLWFKG